jgi:anhydro-N-acetylmuramic acid kinase
MLTRRGLTHDENGALAASGTAAPEIVDAFLSHSYFRRIPPKSLDRDAWGSLTKSIAPLSDSDAAATLTACAAAAVVAGLEHCPSAPTKLLVTGGGRHNGTLMRLLRDTANLPVDPVETVGLDGDMLEAQAFAHLAARVAMGLPTSCPGTTGVRASVSGGTISRPGSLLVAAGASGGSI